MLIQRSHYVMGKGGCATVYLGCVVEKPSPAPSAGTAPMGLSSTTSPSGTLRPEHTPNADTAISPAAAMSPFASSVHSNDTALGGGSARSLSHAVHPGLPPRATLVAVKKKFHSGVRCTLNDRASPSPARTSMLEPEHRLMEAIPPHPNVMPVLASTSVDGCMHYAMPLMDSDIGHEAQRHGFRPTELQALAIARDLLRGIAHVHDQQIAHRDVKPSNALLQRDPTCAIGARVVLSDFGVAHRVTPDAARFASNLCGTRHYQPPEQLLGKLDPRDARSCDVWAVGCILVELLTGQPAFRGATALESLSAMLHGLGSEFHVFPRVVVTPAPLLERLPAATSPDVRDLLLRVLSLCHVDRITAAEALTHRAFEGLDNRLAALGDEAKLPLHGYTAIPSPDTLVFASLQSHSLDMSDLTSNVSTCHRSEARTRACGSGELPVAHSSESRYPTDDERIAASLERKLALSASRSRADGRRVTLGNPVMNALFYAAKSSTDLFGDGSVSPRSSEQYRPSGGAQSSSVGSRRGNLPPSLSTGSLTAMGHPDASPIGCPLSPQRRTLCFDSDEDTPLTRHRVVDPLACTLPLKLAPAESGDALAPAAGPTAW